MTLAKEVTGMTDEEWKQSIRIIEDPVSMLRAIIRDEAFFGYDPYYSDLRAALLEQAEKIVKADDSKNDPAT